MWFQSVSHVKLQKPFLSSRPNLFQIKESTSFNQILTKLRETKTPRIIWLPKPAPNQMAAVLVARILGKRFIWIQGFSNPPKANFIAKILIAQADEIVAKSKKDATKLRAFGISPDKIRYK